MVKRNVRPAKVRGKNIAIVVSQFNEFITKRLFQACRDQLKKCGLQDSQIFVSWVPGSLEIPVTALRWAKKKHINAVICLGCIIRGETYHFELVADQSAYGIMQTSLLTQKPVIFGVLATQTTSQAYKRSQNKGDNKGRDAALAAVSMLNVLAKI